jgi:hypothetical protein
VVEYEWQVCLVYVLAGSKLAGVVAASMIALDKSLENQDWSIET